MQKMCPIINFKNSDFCKLLRLPVSPILKIQYFHLTTVDFYAKTFPILYPCLENSTTGNAIAYIDQKISDVSNSVKDTGV